jgi:hypothetical protein
MAVRPPVLLCPQSQIPNRKYLSLAPRTRLVLGGSLIAWATIGIYVSDTSEKAFGLEATDEDRKRLQEVLPRIREVERRS